LRAGDPGGRSVRPSPAPARSVPRHRHAAPAVHGRDRV